MTGAFWQPITASAHAISANAIDLAIKPSGLRLIVSSSTGNAGAVERPMIGIVDTAVLRVCPPEQGTTGTFFEKFGGDAGADVMPGPWPGGLLPGVVLETDSGGVGLEATKRELCGACGSVGCAGRRSFRQPRKRNRGGRAGAKR